MDMVEVARCKRLRVSDNNEVLASTSMGSDAVPQLLSMPREVLERVLKSLDSISLSRVAQACKAFRGFDNGMRLVEKIAREAVREAVGEECERWRRRNWLGRLYVEDCNVGFANFHWSSSTPSPTEQGAAPQYRFLSPLISGSYLSIKLDGMGPKLLVSDLSTADQPVLRWRLAVRGNTAVEFGVVPLNMVEEDKSLHKCQQEENKFEKLLGPLVDSERPTGFCSSITVGSMLPFKTAIMKGSVVELLARRGRLEILVQNPPDGQELYWHNTRTVPKPYKGPKEVRFEQDFSPDHDIKLALTSWAHGVFDVLHPAPGSRLLGPELQRAWHLSSNSSRSSAYNRSSKRRAAEQQQEQEDDMQQRHVAAPIGATSVAAAVMQGNLLQHQQPGDDDQQQQQQQEQQVVEPGGEGVLPPGARIPAVAEPLTPAAGLAPTAAGGNPPPASPASEQSTGSREAQL
jgi:hypothetical protein